MLSNGGRPSMCYRGEGLAPSATLQGWEVIPKWYATYEGHPEVDLHRKAAGRALLPGGHSIEEE